MAVVWPIAGFGRLSKGIGEPDERESATVIALGNEFHTM
jgi:hypothetical protein